MPLQNRVHPTGSLHALSVHGTLMGNRGGRFHDPETQTLTTGKPWASRAWISCLLAFKGRQRSVWGASYTELFFLDEVTALAAGHRPCFECRRVDAKRFQIAMFDALGGEEGWQAAPKAPEMDQLLHAARCSARRPSARLDQLPAGCIVQWKNDVFAVHREGLRPWSFEGYGEPVLPSPASEVVLVTPVPIVAALRAGYAPRWHPSAV